MSDYTKEYNGIFFISLATLIFGFLGLIVRYTLKSKCEHFKCCFGLFEIDRRVDLEVQEELKQMELGNPSDYHEEEIKIQDSRKNLKRPHKEDDNEESKV
jgi:hypothetical protein